jgi:hypothetical protein
MGPHLRRLWFPVAVAVLGIASYACSLITSYDGFVGGAGPCLACVDSVPGWSGPVALFDSTGMPPVAPPACSGAYATEAYKGSAAPTYTPGPCSCSCSVATAPGCSGTVGAVFTTGSCGTASCLDAEAPPGSCITAPACPASGSLWVSLDTMVPSGGTCDPHPGALPAPMWSELAEACSLTSATQGSCASGQTCAPPPPSGFDSTICIFKSGDVGCPSGTPFLKQHLFYGDFDDKRSCPCSCGMPEGGVCNATVHLYAPGGCSTPKGTIDVADSGCTFLSATNAPVAVDYASQGSTCAPASAQITGTVAGKSPTTVCCTQ